MVTTVRISPLGIFCFVCACFILLYSLRNFLSTNNSLSNEEISVKRLLETSIYLAEKGGRILKDIREKSDLQVCSILNIICLHRYKSSFLSTSTDYVNVLLPDLYFYITVSSLCNGISLGMLILISNFQTSEIFVIQWM